MKLKPYTKDDYQAVCDFLIELCRQDGRQLHWNWGRFEWMMEHPEFDQSLTSSIGLWMEEDRVVGAAIYDMYFGEAFCGVLPEYQALYPEILSYAYRELKDDAGLGVAICDDAPEQIETARAAGFVRAEQTETVLKLELEHPLSAKLPEGLHFEELNPETDAEALQWLFWQGFDHGADREEFEKAEEIVPRIRPHFNRDLSVAAVDAAGEPVSCCCLWFQKGTEYAYVEPVCTVPAWRGKGAAKAVIFEALRRAKAMGAKRAVVLSDMAFYQKLGFVRERHYSFYWKP